MLPDFPEIKQWIQENLNKHLRDSVRDDPLLSRIREYHFSEGHKWIIEKENGTIEESEFKKIEGMVQIETRDVIEKGVEAFTESRLQISDEIKKQQAELLLKEVKQAAEQAGNVVDHRGKPFSFETFMELLEKVTIDFDEAGIARLPALVVAPELADKIAKKIPIWEANKQYIQQYNELIEKKKIEWHDRESNRKLVD